MKKMVGKTIIAQKDKRLNGVVFFDKDENITQKQFYKNYEAHQGLLFPSEMIQVTPGPNKEYYKITTFRNVVVNEMENSMMYNYKVD